MKNQKKDERDNPSELSADDLLQFLEAVPQILRERENLVTRAPVGVTGCPEPEMYMRLVLGELAGDEVQALEQHAAGCAECGKRSLQSRSVLEGNPSAAETAAIAELAASRAEWQKQMARQLAATPAHRRPAGLLVGWPGRAWIWGAGIAATVAVVAGGFAWEHARNTPERQLAKVYEETRTLELRIPEAGFAGFVLNGHTRGGAADREPAELLDARAKLARELERSPENGHWLELEARADVLEEKYDSAIEVLTRLMAEGPVTAELLTDAASAYYQRGLVTGSEGDRSTALDDLAQADKLSPADPVILFNEAIVMEDRGQMMNAVEVWNRFITVERDAKWREEGKRKLAALEQTLTRLKSHESRVRQVLASPAAMISLAGDKKTLAGLDEELSAYELDKLLLAAFPEAVIASHSGQEQARGSPCLESCIAARRLLQAIGKSLEIKHHDSWLSDLIPNDIDGFPAAVTASYARGLRLLARAMRDDVSDLPVEGAQLAAQARDAFGQPAISRGAKLTEAQAAELRVALHVAERRAGLERLFALQLHVNFEKCRQMAGQFRGAPEAERDDARYPWMAAQERVTEKVCDSTPETRAAGRTLAQEALRIAKADDYGLMQSRASLMMAGELVDSGDTEAAERLSLASLRELYAGDSPALRIQIVFGRVARAEAAAGRSHSSELSSLEQLRWEELGELKVQVAETRVFLAEAELRNGELSEAEREIRLSESEGSAKTLGKTEGANLAQGVEMLASAMLEGGDLAVASRYLDEAATPLMHSSDTYLERSDAMNRGQLELALGHPDRSESLLESAIRLSEGSDVRRGDRATSAEFGGQDHDAYAELAASWLAQGRPAESVLALWERFRLRSRGLPITQCRDGALDCELPRLLAEQRRLGGSIVMGQVVLLDRVLVYRMDRDTVEWSERRMARQGLLDAAQRLEQAVSSPQTSAETAERLGAGLAKALLPNLPASLSGHDALLLEPDPQLANLSWPVLPTVAGPLGIAYPLAEMRSILANGVGDGLPRSRPVGRALVVGASVATEGEPPLPEAMSEASDVGRLLHAPEILLGEQATAARVGADLGSATIFHFAGHALQTQSGTELLLAAASPGDRQPWVDGKFLSQHPPRVCRLAVLSACATGTHEAAWNHPLQSMVETLASLDVPEVVATRWQIDSQASVPLIDAFYGGLAKGDTPAMALATARKLQFGNSSYRNPYYWGAYYVTGREAHSLLAIR